MDLNPDGTVRRFLLTTRTVSGSGEPVVTRSTIDFTGDSAIMVTPRGDSSVTTRLAPGKGAVPFLAGVMGVMDQIAHQFRAAGRDTYRINMFPPGSRQLFQTTVTAKGKDKVILDVVSPVGPIPPFTLVTDAEGSLKSFSGRGSTFQAEAERIKQVNLEEASALFQSRPLGALSPRDTARATLGDASLWVDYGRPSKRGRVIFGTVVPWDTVWRTGANAATQFHTPVDVVIGDAEIPAGTYSLWTLPSQQGWKLIINRQIGQWGTQYDPARDLARVNMKVETVAEPVEQLAIAMVPADGSATLTMTWDRTRVSVPVRRKQ
jgi:hypothetical protein